MVLTFKKVYGSQEPLPIDTVSSPTVVYIHKNIELVTKKDIEGNEYQEWEYDRATLTKEEYTMYQIEQDSNTANLGTEVAVAELAETIEETKNEMELALAELAEAIM